MSPRRESWRGRLAFSAAGAGVALLALALVPRQPPRPLPADRNVAHWLEADAEGAFPVRLDPDDVHFRAHSPLPRIVLHNQQLEGPNETNVNVPLTVTNLNRDVASLVESPAIRDVSWPTPTTFRARIDVAPNGSTAVEFRDLHPDQPARFFLGADPELNFDVLERFLARAREERPDFVWILGDLLQELDWIGDSYLRIFEQAEVPVYVTIGNHDMVHDRRHGPFEARKENFRRLFGPTDYTFDFRGSRFVALDTAAPYILPSRFEWLRTTLDGAPEGPRFVLTHKPFVDPRPGKSHTIESDWDALRLEDLLASVPGVTYYCGHVEGYYRHDPRGIPVRIVGSLTREGLLERDEGGRNGYVAVRVGPRGPEEDRVELEEAGVAVEVLRMATTCGPAYAQHHPAGPSGALFLLGAAAGAVRHLRRARRRRRLTARIAALLAAGRNTRGDWAPVP